MHGVFYPICSRVRRRTLLGVRFYVHFWCRRKDHEWYTHVVKSCHQVKSERIYYRNVHLPIRFSQRLFIVKARLRRFTNPMWTLQREWLIFVVGTFEIWRLRGVERDHSYNWKREELYDTLVDLTSKVTSVTCFYVERDQCRHYCLFHTLKQILPHSGLPTFQLSKVLQTVERNFVEVVPSNRLHFCFVNMTNVEILKFSVCLRYKISR